MTKQNKTLHNFFIKRRRSFSILLVSFLIFSFVPPADIMADSDPVIWYDDIQYGDLLIDNLFITTENNNSTLHCYIENTGDTIFNGEKLDIHLYNESDSNYLTMIAYFGEKLEPNSKRWVTSCTDMDLINEHRPAKIGFSFSNDDASINPAVSMDSALQNIYNYKSSDLWLYRGFYAFHLILQNKNSYITIGKSFDIYYDYFDADGNKLFRYTHTIAEGEEIESFIDDFYTATDLSKTSQIHITSSLSNNESFEIVEPSPSPTPANTPTPAPTVSASPSPSTPAAEDVPNTTKPSAETTKPAPTTTPATASVKKNTKLPRPKIKVTLKKQSNSLSVITIKLKKYYGTHIEIYYKKNKKKFKKIKLKNARIKKNKGIFRIGYQNKKKKIYIRVRTYRKKGKKTQYSKYSKTFRI